MENQQKSWIKKNWLGVLGVVLGVLGLGSSFYFYKQSIKEREPMLLTDPARTLIVDSSPIIDSPLKVVRSDGSMVQGDISSVQFYFWNNGTMSIKKSDILSPILLSIEGDKIEILDFKILSASRSKITLPALNLIDKKGKQYLRVDFKILEHNDGFTAQLLYSGNPYADLELEGSIEGVNEIKTNLTLNKFHFYKTLGMNIGIPMIIVAILFALILLKPKQFGSLFMPFAGDILSDLISEIPRKLRVSLAVAVVLGILIAPFIIYQIDKEKIDKQATESLIGIIPHTIVPYGK